MKKVAIWMILVLALAMLAVPVLAAGSASMTVSASKNVVTQGDTFTVSVSVSKTENCASGGFLFQYDQNAFEYVKGSAKVSGFALSGISTVKDKIAGYFMSTGSAATVEGTIFQITLKVKNTASAGTYTISGTPSLADQNKENFSVSVNSITITVGSNEPSEKPTEEVTNTTAATETTEAPAAETSEAPADVDVTEEPAVEKVETPNTQPSEIITIGAIPSTEKDPTTAGFPWWIIFAVMGIGSIVAIIVIKSKS